MNKSYFDALIERIRRESLDTLLKKSDRYAGPWEDRLYNFKAGADIISGTPAQACWGYLAKHLAALRDMVERNDFTDREDFKEKCVDSINYICLLFCIGMEPKDADTKQEEKDRITKMWKDWVL